MTPGDLHLKDGHHGRSQNRPNHRALTRRPKIRRARPSRSLKLVEQYESVIIDGRHRRFPMKALLGAEKVVHRVWTEHYKTQQRTPLHLHELMEARCFDSCGQLNTLSAQFRQKAAQQRLTVDKDSHTILVEDEQTWSPKRILSVLDSLTAIRQCWTLLRIGHELDVQAYIDWWVHLFRSKQGKMEELKVYWVEAGWRLALELRQQNDFQTVTRDIMDDTAALQTALAKEANRSKGSGKTTPTKTQERSRSTREWPKTQNSNSSGSRWPQDRRPWNSSGWQNKRQHGDDSRHADSKHG